MANNTTYDFTLDLGREGSSTVEVTTDGTATRDELGNLLADAIKNDKLFNKHVDAAYDGATGNLILTAKTRDTAGNDYKVSSAIAPYMNPGGIIIDASNNTLTVNEPGALAVTLEQGVYGTPDELAAHVEKRLTEESLAGGAGIAYTVSWDDQNGLFTVSGDANFSVAWTAQPGIARALGFNADDPLGMTHAGDFAVSSHEQFSGAVDKIESGFVFSAGVNDSLQLTVNDGWPIDINIINDSDAVAGKVYTGEEVASFLEQAVEQGALSDMGKEMDFTVMYDADDNRFSILNEESNMNNSKIVIGPQNSTLTIDESPTPPGGVLAVNLTQKTYSSPTELAQHIQEQLNLASGLINYTVSWDALSGQFSVSGDSDFDIPWTAQHEIANALGFNSDVGDDDTGRDSYIGDFSAVKDPEVEFLWYDAASTIADTIGYDTNGGVPPVPAESPVTPGQADVSDFQVEYNVITNVNDVFSITVDGVAAAAPIQLAQGSYTAEELAQEMQNKINADANISAMPSEVSVNYSVTSGGLFAVQSGSSGANSQIRIAAGANDFLRTVGLDLSESVDGEQSVLLEDLNHGEGVQTTGGLLMKDRAGKLRVTLHG